jgi:hypothetical protein
LPTSSVTAANTSADAAPPATTARDPAQRGLLLGEDRVALVVRVVAVVAPPGDPRRGAKRSGRRVHGEAESTPALSAAA